MKNYNPAAPVQVFRGRLGKHAPNPKVLKNKASPRAGNNTETLLC